MAEFGLAPAPSQDPVGGFMQGATQGIGLVDVLRKRHRDIQLENQQDTLAIVKLIQELGVARARAVAQQAGLQGDPSLFAGGPAQGAEERKKVTPSQLSAFGLAAGGGPISAEDLTGIGNVLRGQAAGTAASNVSKARAGDVQALESQSKLLTEDILNLRNRANNVLTSEADRAALGLELSQKQKALEDLTFLTQVAAGVRSRGGGLTGKFKGANLPSAGGANPDNPYALTPATTPQ